MRTTIFSVILGLSAGLIIGAFATDVFQLVQSTTPQSLLPSLQGIAGNSKLPTFVENRTECEESAVVAANRAWMEACYLKGELNGQCEQLFDPDGNYYYYFAVPPIGDARSAYERDEKACACALPTNLGSYLNEQQSDSFSACSDFPESVSSLQ
jgi:hypothetical protein